MKRGDVIPPCVRTHERQRPDNGLRKFQGNDVLAVQTGTCMHCRRDLTTLLVATGNSRRWVNTETFGPKGVEHVCSRATR